MINLKNQSQVQIRKEKKERKVKRKNDVIKLLKINKI